MVIELTAAEPVRIDVEIEHVANTLAVCSSLQQSNFINFLFLYLHRICAGRAEFNDQLLAIVSTLSEQSKEGLIEMVEFIKIKEHKEQEHG
jgi:hypothetical protein